jgi:hypothetical protein
MNSIGIGKIIVELCSAAMLQKVVFIKIQFDVRVFVITVYKISAPVQGLQIS